MTADDFEKLPPLERLEAIAEANAETRHYGFCQGCGGKIEALLKDWPKECPRCGYDGSHKH
jgi:NADH pyrophosphatase NudC (nudix superfamily)